MSEDYFTDPVHIPVDGVLDLHHFSPRDLKTLIPDYLEECHRRHIREIRLIHGKGTGTLRRTVEALLKDNRLVQSYRPAEANRGGWGATLVTLRSRSTL